MYDRRKILRFPFPKFHKSDLSHSSQDRNINFGAVLLQRQPCRLQGGRETTQAKHELMLVRLKRLNKSCNGKDHAFFAVQCKARAGTRKKKTSTTRRFAKKFRVSAPSSFSSTLNRSMSHGV